MKCYQYEKRNIDKPVCLVSGHQPPFIISSKQNNNISIITKIVPYSSVAFILKAHWKTAAITLNISAESPPVSQIFYRCLPVANIEYGRRGVTLRDIWADNLKKKIKCILHKRVLFVNLNAKNADALAIYAPLTYFFRRLTAWCRTVGGQWCC